MSLPNIELSKYHVELPSTGETVMFRPFLVREQKQLLVAVNGDKLQQTQAMYDIINICTFGKIDAAHIPAYDAEFLFMQIRSRSIGEHVDLLLTCNQCQQEQPGQLDLTAVQVQKPEGHVRDIDLGNGLVLTMQDPNLLDVELVRNDPTPDAVIELIARSIRSIWQGDEMYSTADYSLAELVDWVEQLSPRNLDQLQSFYETLPVLRHELKFECKHCGAENTAVLEGLQGFFV